MKREKEKNQKKKEKQTKKDSFLRSLIWFFDETEEQRLLMNWVANDETQTHFNQKSNK